MKLPTGYQQVSPPVPVKALCQCVARPPLPEVQQCVPNKACCWDVGEVGDRVRHGEPDWKWAGGSGLHSP